MLHYTFVHNMVWQNSEYLTKVSYDTVHHVNNLLLFYPKLRYDVEKDY